MPARFGRHGQLDQRSIVSPATRAHGGPTAILTRRIRSFRFERERLLELLAGAHGDGLGVIDLQIRALEAQLVPAAGDAVVGERGVLAGVLAVDPDLGPGARPDGDAAVATLGGVAAALDALARAFARRRRRTGIARLLATSLRAGSVAEAWLSNRRRAGAADPTRRGGRRAARAWSAARAVSDLGLGACGRLRPSSRLWPRRAARPWPACSPRRRRWRHQRRVHLLDAPASRSISSRQGWKRFSPLISSTWWPAGMR